MRRTTLLMLHGLISAQGGVGVCSLAINSTRDGKPSSIHADDMYTDLACQLPRHLSQDPAPVEQDLPLAEQQMHPGLTWPSVEALKVEIEEPAGHAEGPQ